MLLFGSSPGIVGLVVSGTTLPFAVQIGGNPGVLAFPTPSLAKAILTNFDVAGRSGLGISHSLNSRIYAYVFGERIGAAKVGGIAFAGFCQSPGGNWTGFDAVYSYYENVRSSAQGAPVTLVFGPNTALSGMMDEFGFRLEDPDTGIGSFSFMFKAFPRNATGGVLPPPPWVS